MAIHSRVDLIQYALRKLGSPVINIEVDMLQVEDRVDEAIQFFQDFHYDGKERVYLKHQITGTTVTVDSTAGFIIGETVVGQTSNNRFIIEQINSPTLLTTKYIKNASGVSQKTFTAGETLLGETSGAVTAFTSSVPGDIENGYVPVSDMVTGVIRVIPWYHSAAPTVRSTDYMFNPQYQIVMSTFQNLSSSSMIYYEQLTQHMNLMDQILRPIDSLRFNQKMGRIYLDIDWDNADIGTYFVFDCYRILDPEVFHEIYNDRMLKKLVTAKVKLQWASNTQKYAGIQLLGGVTIDAATLMSQAVAEIEAAEEEIRSNYEEAPIGFIG